MELRNTLLLVFWSFALLISQRLQVTAATPSIPAVFAFGDSTLDPGNNNGLTTLFRGDHAPYGRDFPGHVATGRFSNGNLTTDNVVSTLGLKDVLPAYRDPEVTDKDLLTGVSFASAGSGLDDLTANLGNVLNMTTQLEEFDIAVKRIEGVVGANETKRLVGEALYVIGVGTNDVVYNLYIGISPRNFQFTASTYQDFLLQRLDSFVQSLYRRGARKIVVAGLPPVGCLPLQVTISSIMTGQNLLQRVCNSRQNTDSQTYNAKLQSLISALRASLPSSKVAYFDIYNVMMDMILNPTRYGFRVTLEGCCGTGLLELGPLCVQGMPTCADANRYMFWDAIHPTQATYWFLSSFFQQTVLPAFN